MWRQPRSAYRHPVRHGTPVTISVVAPTLGAAAIPSSACWTGSYQYTPSSKPARPRAATYSSSGNRPPAEPAARNNTTRSPLRFPVVTTPADRNNSRASAVTSRTADVASCPARTVAAGPPMSQSVGSGNRVPTS